MRTSTARPGTARVAAWVAIVAVAFAALAPTLSRAFAAARLAPAWVEVCTENGPRLARSGSDSVDPTPPGDRTAASMELCAYCALQHHAMGLPPTPPAPALAVPARMAHASPVVSAPARARPAWARARPRDPPAQS